MAKKKPRTISLDKLTEKYFGKKGTAKRDAYDAEVSAEIKKERLKQAELTELEFDVTAGLDKPKEWSKGKMKRVKDFIASHSKKKKK